MRTKIMYIIVVLCALSFMAGFGIEKAWGFSGNRDAAALLVILAAGDDHHKDMGIVDVIAPEEGCPIKQMHKNRELKADIVYLKESDWTDNDISVVFDKLRVIELHFTDKAITTDRITLGITDQVDWHPGIKLDKGEGVYIILR